MGDLIISVSHRWLRSTVVIATFLAFPAAAQEERFEPQLHDLRALPPDEWIATEPAEQLDVVEDIMRFQEWDYHFPPQRRGAARDIDRDRGMWPYEVAEHLAALLSIEADPVAALHLYHVVVEQGPSSSDDFRRWRRGLAETSAHPVLRATVLSDLLAEQEVSWSDPDDRALIEDVARTSAWGRALRLEAMTTVEGATPEAVAAVREALDPAEDPIVTTEALRIVTEGRGFAPGVAEELRRMLLEDRRPVVAALLPRAVRMLHNQPCDVKGLALAAEAYDAGVEGALWLAEMMLLDLQRSIVLDPVLRPIVFQEGLPPAIAEAWTSHGDDERSDMPATIAAVAEGDEHGAARLIAREWLHACDGRPRDEAALRGAALGAEDPVERAVAIHLASEIDGVLAGAEGDLLGLLADHGTPLVLRNAAAKALYQGQSLDVPFEALRDASLSDLRRPDFVALPHAVIGAVVLSILFDPEDGPRLLLDAFEDAPSEAARLAVAEALLPASPGVVPEAMGPEELARLVRSSLARSDEVALHDLVVGRLAHPLDLDDPQRAGLARELRQRLADGALLAELATRLERIVDRLEAAE